jgi:hypothetical protein
MNDMENMRVFADQLWKYMVPKLDSKFASNVSYFRAEVVSNPGNNKLEVQRPVENGTLTLPCVRAMSGAQAGQQVVALVMGSMSNAIIVGDGKLNVPGGGGDAGIANFQAQPDGSLVITLTDGTTFTATPVINAFANVKVGSTTISADNNADTLTLNAGGLVNLTGDATNDSVTISVDPNHTHDASDIVSGILPAERGGTQNGNGYIQMGQKSGTTVGFCSTAEGLQTQSLGLYCHAEGYATTAGTTASNSAYAHSEGQNTTASGNASHSEGSYTTSSGGSSHAEGSNTVASGRYSHSEGWYTTANHRSQHVFGEYNTADNSSAEGFGRGNYVEIVGNGASESARSNARTLDWSGNEWIAGTLTQASDARLKDVQGEIPDLSSIRAVRFRWKNGDDKEHLGYLAQDVEGIAPYLVGVDSNGYKSLDYIALLTAKVEMLEQEIEKLKGR